MFPTDPFVRPSTKDVRAFVLQIASSLAEKYRVELRWDDPTRVSLPNGAFMVGIPKSEIREYYTITLPTWATPSQLYGMIDATMQWKLASKKKNWLARAWVWINGAPGPNPRAVPEPTGLFFVDKFSV